MRILLVFIAAFAAVAFSAVVQMPMHKTRSLRQKLLKENRITEYLYRQKLISSQAATGSEPFIDYYDDFYMGNVTLGSNKQEFTVVLDTGSSDMWVIDIACRNQDCKGTPSSGYTKNRFDPSKSSSFTKSTQKFRLNYASGSCMGYIGYDTMTLGGLTYETQGFGVAEHIADVFGNTPMDGALGLAWPALSFKGVNPPVTNLLPQLDEQIFTVWLDRHVKPAHAQLGGLITYGATDPVNCEDDISYVTLSAKTYWQFPLNKFSVPGYSTQQTQQAISDTGTSWIGAPSAAFSGAVAATGAVYNPFSQLYQLPCKGDYPDWVFTIGGEDFRVPSTEYVLDLDLGNGACAVAAYSNSGGGGFAPDWILGDTWIRTYCQIHDIGQARIGFAKARHTEIPEV